MQTKSQAVTLCHYEVLYCVCVCVCVGGGGGGGVPSPSVKTLHLLAFSPSRSWEKMLEGLVRTATPGCMYV